MIYLPKHISNMLRNMPSLRQIVKTPNKRKTQLNYKPVLKLKLPQIPINQLQSKIREARKARAQINITNPLPNIMKNLSSSLNKLTYRPPKEDYESAVKKFLPSGAEPVKPQYPAKSKFISRMDVDGDSQSELIASYKLNNEIKTLVMKKREGQWNKITEINNPGFDRVNFMGMANITGDGSKQLLLGLKTKDDMGILNGYNIRAQGTHKLFSHNYRQLDILEASNKTDKSRLAFWEGVGNDAYRVEVKHWNGSQLEHTNDQASYYQKKMLPYYGQKVRQTPQNSSNWYYLADALYNAEMYRDAEKAVEFGLSLNPDATLKEDFLALRQKISK